MFVAKFPGICGFLQYDYTITPLSVQAERGVFYSEVSRAIPADAAVFGAGEIFAGTEFVLPV